MHNAEKEESVRPFKRFAALIISNEDVYKIATRRVLKKHGLKPADYPKRFSTLVDEIGREAYALYLSEEERSGERVLREFFRKSKTRGIFKKLDRFFLSISQSRKTRAGKAFEEIIKALFRKCDYPFDEQRVINGKPDFLMPSEKHFRKNAPDCIIFTAKRTLRERWRQIATEGLRGLGFFLATIDGGISSKQAREMLTHRIYMVVPQSLKQGISDYKKAANIITFEDFFTDHLDAAMRRWRRAGVI